MRPLSHIVFAALLALGAPHAAAQNAADLGIEGRYIGQAIFSSMDENDRGLIHMGHLEEFRASVFAGMDSDDDGRITYPEFAAWDPGFAAVAASVGRADAHVTASRIVFAFWDQNGDGELTDRELRIAMTQDFRRADSDHDTLLTEEEFISGFPIMIAMRAAIRPDL